ncbi:MAG: sulfurtransferase TusA family protein [Phycisphaerales bacterium]|nr:MAG: sulfurtransferase TusA family protein [Phycisphaerales bacterium]
MDTGKQPILHIPQSVVDDINGYRGQVEKFLKGETSPVAFRAYRVPMGIYEQRTEGSFMVRIRIGAGMVLPYQLERIARLSKTCGNGILHVTTRQDIQIHEVSIEDTPDVLEGLLEVGLSSRGGGGNTVRNVTACPRAGVCRREQFDVAPYAVATAEYLLQFRSSYNLPRKYKIVFSGCSDDCAFASVADLGFFARVQDGAKGFAVYAGGGLGSNPNVAVKIEDFVGDSEIFEVAEAIKRLFDKHGDRANKHRARLRYVLARIGPEQFVKLYKDERREVAKQGLEGLIPEIRATSVSPVEPTEPGDKDAGPKQYAANVEPEKIEGLFTVEIGLNLGDILADDLAEVGQIAEEFGRGVVRTTQLQNLLITGVAGSDVFRVNDRLSELSVDLTATDKPHIVACAGAATCKLGLCLSRGLAQAISDRLADEEISDRIRETSIRISGCPNSCGHHLIADIGLQGRAKRINGRLLPCYDVLAGAKTREADARLAERVGTVPAKRIPDMLAEAFKQDASDPQLLTDLVQRYSNFSPDQLADDYYFDHGSDEPFSLAGRGPGECGAGVMDVIKLDIDEAKEAIQAALLAQWETDLSDHLYKALLAATRSLLVIFGLEPKNDRETFTQFSDNLIRPGWVEPQTQQLLHKAIDWRMGDRASLDDLGPQTTALVRRVEELFLSLDANLKFKAEPIVQEDDPTQAEGQTHTIDLRGVACPLNFVKAKIELEKIAVGEILEVLLDEGEPVRNVPDSFAAQGHEVVRIDGVGDHFCVGVRRKK